jgi:hypothetical protein
LRAHRAEDKIKNKKNKFKHENSNSNYVFINSSYTIIIIQESTPFTYLAQLRMHKELLNFNLIERVKFGSLLYYQLILISSLKLTLTIEFFSLFVSFASISLSLSLNCQISSPFLFNLEGLYRVEL